MILNLFYASRLAN